MQHKHAGQLLDVFQSDEIQSVTAALTKLNDTPNSGEQFKDYRSGIYTCPDNGDFQDSSKVDHAVVLVGYGNENGTDSTNNNYLTLDDGADTFEKENTTQLAARLMKFIQNLEAAMVRIENKTYGVCKTTGKLIPKERLRAVPHTTQTIEAKLSK